jgi:hypothetical protein
MKVLQINLISLLKSHQFIALIIIAIPSLNFLTIIRFQTHAIPLTQLAKNILKLINHHTHWRILFKCNTIKTKGKYHIAFDFFFQYPQ